MRNATDKFSYGWMSSTRGIVGGGGPLAYHLGYPAYTGAGTEPNVSYQFVFDEASGNIVDEVGGVTLPVTGSPGYSNTLTDEFEGISPGVSISDGNFFASTAAGAITAATIGTSDFTQEMWISATAMVNGRPVYASYDESGTANGILAYFANTNRLELFIKFTDASSATISCTLGAGFFDGLPHKIRITFDRSGLVTWYLDGVALSTSDISTHDGKTISAKGIAFGDYTDGLATGATFKIYEFRQSLNLTNNSGGPNGG